MPFFGDLYFSFFIEAACCHFEGFFAHAEEGVDGFGVGFIVVGQVAFVLFQEAENFVGSVFGAFVSGFACDHVDLRFAWRLNLLRVRCFDESFELVAYADVAEDLMKWSTPVN